MIRIVLKPARDKAIKSHHPWLFSGAIKKIDATPHNGEIVEVVSSDGNYLGQGFYNNGRTIAVRFLTFEDEKIDRAFWRVRIQQALNLRIRLFDTSKTNAYRLIHGEGDFLPGLTVDRYGEYLILQSSTAGIDLVKKEIVSVLNELLTPAGIYERSDSASRHVERLPQVKGIISGIVPETICIKENGINFEINVHTGQKTGFFLDQRNSRAFVGVLKARNVLNCFSYSGGFSIYAANSGAQTTNVDISPEALNLARKNYALNNIDASLHSFIEADVFGYLRLLKEAKPTFDCIILDPPAFAKNQASVKQAARGYKDINLQAMRILPPGGLLITCSCSQHIDRLLFQKIVHDASIDAGRTLQIIAILGQAEDHPINAAHPEGEYLKCLVCRVN